jgi:filamentous hemagglutinin family protein
MNAIYTSIWNQNTGTYVAASENAKSAGKTASRRTGARAVFSLFKLNALAALLTLSFGGSAYATPVGGVVTAGAAGIKNGAANTLITQTTQNAAIHWLSFNIGAGESVKFLQPSSNSVILNRVSGSDPSNIFGSLSANGQVFLVNPNGILFGKGAQVNLGALVASALSIKDQDFMAGQYRFGGSGDGAVVNQGHLFAQPGGYIALLGANVRNEGVIVATLGTVALAGGSGITLDLAGDGLLNVAVNQGALHALVTNGGLIQADGGSVLLSARSAGGLLPSAVNNTGVIQAQTLVNRKGQILLLGDMQDGAVNVSGTLDASAPKGGDGGFIETSAARVTVADKSVNTTRSAQGKSGTWLIDPNDFTVAAGADISGAALSSSLETTSVTLLSSAGTTGINGDVNVNEAVTWTAPTTLNLTALRDVNIAAAVTGTNGSLVASAVRDINLSAPTTTTTGNLSFTAGNNINLAAATTITTGNLKAIAGQDVNVSAVSSVTTGNMVLHADNDGSGPGAAIGGTVAISCGSNCLTINSGALDIRFNPASYSTTAAEITAYASNLTGGGSLLAKAWVFGKGTDKTYDGTTAATVTSFKPDITNATPPVTLTDASNAIFDTKNVGPNKPITFNSGFTDAVYALFAPEGAAAGVYTARAAITPAPLTVTASNTTKTYGQTPTLSGFTTSALVNGETVGAVTQTSPGTVATAAVAGSPYAITPSEATGGTFTPSNCTISYANGALTVTPAPLAVIPPPLTGTPVPLTEVPVPLTVIPPPLAEVPAPLTVTPPPLAEVPAPLTVIPPPLAEVPVPLALTPAIVAPLEALPLVTPPVTELVEVPAVTPANAPPELLTLAAPEPSAPVVAFPAAVPLRPEPVLTPAPVIVSVLPPPAVYVAPVRPRKQDRN